MTTYAWPTSRHFVPASHELRVIDNTQRTVESSLSGYVQTNAMPGARWGWGMDFTPHTQAQRAELEAYLLRLSGRQHRVQLWDMRNPRPRGNVQLTGVTLGATAAQFATTLQLAGCRAGANLIPGGSFEMDSNADGVADGWTLFVGGAGDAGRVHSRVLIDNPLNVVHGSLAQYVTITSAGNSSDSGLVSARFPVLPSTVYTLSGYMYCSAAATQYMAARQYKADNTTQTGADAVTGFASNASMQRMSVTFTTQADAAFVAIYVRGINAVGQDMRVDAVQLEAAPSATPYAGFATLLAGDWLGLTGGQLVRVVADATATDAGAMTVEVRHMLRSAVASGSAVTLDKPTALYVRTEAPLALPRMPGNVDPGLSIDLVEVFA